MPVAISTTGLVAIFGIVASAALGIASASADLPEAWAEMVENMEFDESS
jgi:hypothetical protein